jgi:AraC family transcriptional regulator
LPTIARLTYSDDQPIVTNRKKRQERRVGLGKLSRMNSGAASRNVFQEVIPLLIEVQQNLDQDLNLESLARKYGYSPFHFHRIFSDLVGETPKKYVERLRLEKAVYKLQITDEPVLDVCLSVGFKNHETFTRAFQRYFGVSPRDCRKNAKVLQIRRLKANRSFRGDSCSLSEVKFELLRSTRLLSIMHVGAYSELPAAFTKDDRIWNTLVQWATRHNVPYRRIPMSFYHDNPTVTPKAAQRTDGCISIDTTVTETRTIRCVDFVGGEYAVAEHLGPYSTLIQGFRHVADGVRASGKYAFRTDPALAIARGIHLDKDSMLNHTDVYLPVQKT